MGPRAEPPERGRLGWRGSDGPVATDVPRAPQYAGSHSHAAPVLVRGSLAGELRLAAREKRTADDFRDLAARDICKWSEVFALLRVARLARPAAIVATD